MDEKVVAFSTDDSDICTTDDEAIDFTTAKKTNLISMDDSAMDCTSDQKPIDLSKTDLPGPIDLTKCKTSDKEEPTKLPGGSLSVPTDVKKTFHIYPETSLPNREPRPAQLPFESKPAILSLALGKDVPCREPGESGGGKLASPMTSPILYPPSLFQASSPINSVESPSAMQPLSPMPESPSLDTSMDEGGHKRYSSSSRLFNVLAKQYIGDIECPPRPGHRQGASKAPGGPPTREDNETDAAYRERRSKNNLAARRSRDKRKMKCDLLIQKTAQFKQETIDILNEITSMQKSMVDRGFQLPLPFQDELDFIREELNMFS